jgi:signal transduction histidine kinase
LTGYAPIKDAFGNTIAVLATDVKADDFLNITTQTLLPFIIFIVFLTITISFLTISILVAWRHYAKSLEDLNNKIIFANEKLQSVDKLKTEFLSLASHQLRTPLTAIKGYSSMLVEGSFGKLDPKVEEPIKRIYTSAQGLVSIVEDLLNVSKIEQGGMKYEIMPTDLVPLVQSLYNEMQIPAQSKNIIFGIDIPKDQKIIANIDPTKLKQVFLNLADNSIKYTQTGGTITVSLKRLDDTIEFAVKDNGIGISPETKAKLFGKFARGEGGKMNTGGSGLGLYLAQQIARAHKGDIVIESDGLGKGSTFKVVLPAM